MEEEEGPSAEPEAAEEAAQPPIDFRADEGAFPGRPEETTSLEAREDGNRRPPRLTG